MENWSTAGCCTCVIHWVAIFVQVAWSLRSKPRAAHETAICTKSMDFPLALRLPPRGVAHQVDGAKHSLGQAKPAPCKVLRHLPEAQQAPRGATCTPPELEMLFLIIARRSWLELSSSGQQQSSVGTWPHTAKTRGIAAQSPFLARMGPLSVSTGEDSSIGISAGEAHPQRQHGRLYDAENTPGREFHVPILATHLHKN